MADSVQGKKPRIRKKSLTMREKAESAQNQAENPKKKRLSALKSKVAPVAKRPLAKARKPFTALNTRRPKLPQSKALTIIGIPFRFIGKILNLLAPRYFINSWKEVRLVTWPSRRETWRLTLAVFIFAIIFGSVAYGVDTLLDKIFKVFVLK